MPVAELPAVIESHEALLDAVHAQALGDAVTATEAPPPGNAGVAPVGFSVKVQGAAAWVIVKVWPAIVSVPSRWAGSGFAATV